MKTQSYVPYIIAGAAGAVVASVIPLLICPSKAETKLLPFQGRLTDATGAPVGDGAKVVEFKMYDAPTGGAVKWAGEVHKLSVNGGLVNTMLGSKSSLGGVDFSSPTYLQITIDADNNYQISAADPPLLPRQIVTGSVYAAESGNSRRLDDHPAAEYQAIFDGGNPASGQIIGSKIKPGSLPGLALGFNSVTADQIATGAVKSAELDSDSVTTDKIKDGEVKSDDISDGAVSIRKLAFRNTGGGEGHVSLGITANSDLSGTQEQPLSQLQTTLATTGRPVLIVCIPGELSDESFIHNTNTGSNNFTIFRLKRTGTGGAADLSSVRFLHRATPTLNPQGTRSEISLQSPPSSLMWIDVPPAGSVTYRVWGKGTSAADEFGCHNVRLAAFEL